MVVVYEKAVEKLGLDIKKVESLVRRMNKVNKEAKKMGLTIFGGSSNGSLRGGHDMIVAELSGGNFDGGDGATQEDDEGLLRGEGYFVDKNMKIRL